jgi:DNA-directed RNA polymerase subunit F
MVEGEKIITNEVWFENDQEILYVRLVGNLSDDKCKKVISEINETPAEKKSRLLIMADNFEILTGLDQDSSEFLSKKVVMKDGQKVGIVDIYPTTRVRRNFLLGLFFGDYQAQFFATREEAVKWLRNGKKH